MRTFVCIGFAALMGTMGCKASVKINEPEPEPQPVAEPEPPPPAPEPEPPPPEDPSDVRIEGDHITIDKKIHFATDSDVIQEDSFELLDHIATLLKNHEEVKTLHIIGHTDAKGSKAHNKDLSERRAASVMKALKDRGVSQELDSRGAGMEEPTCKENTDDCHEKNRRVEFLVEMAES